jgi:glycosyltransferase involved in cell wall biosynthesis
MTSVLEQSYSNIEYIVIDGGSTDGSKAYIEGCEHYLNYWISEPDEGIYNAMNKGIDQATGDYVLFMNGGDILSGNQIIEQSLPKFLNYDLVCFDINVIGLKEPFVKRCPDRLSFYFMFTDTLPHQSTFVKRTCFELIGKYDEELTIVSDWKFFLLATGKYDMSYRHVDMVLSTYYLDGISAQKANRPKLLKERQLVLEKEFPFFVNDMNDLKSLKAKVKNLRDSKKINVLIKLGLINTF